MTEATELDARRLLCPLPVIRLQDQVNHVAPGDRVRITCTDPGTLNDIPTWCRINGHSVIEISERDQDIVFVVEKGAAGD